MFLYALKIGRYQGVPTGNRRSFLRISLLISLLTGWRDSNEPAVHGTVRAKAPAPQKDRQNSGKCGTICLSASADAISTRDTMLEIAAAFTVPPELGLRLG